MKDKITYMCLDNYGEMIAEFIDENEAIEYAENHLDKVCEVCVYINDIPDMQVWGGIKMKAIVEKNINHLYYLRTRMGSGGSPRKTFVRISYEKKNGELGSRYYCSAKSTAILFENKREALEFEAHYNTIGEVVELKLIAREIELIELNINGYRCYELKDPYRCHYE